MDDPAEQDGPERGGGHEHDHGDEETALDQLPESRDEKTADGGNDIARFALSGSHGRKLVGRRRKFEV